MDRIDRIVRAVDKPLSQLAVIGVLVMLLVSISSCSPRIVERIVVQHDTTTVVKIDSVWQYQRDSVFVKEKGDTVYKYVEHIRYRDRYKVDTLVKVKVDSVIVDRPVPVEKKLSSGQMIKIGSFWWLVGICAALLIWTFRKKIFPWLRS